MLLSFVAICYILTGAGLLLGPTFIPRLLEATEGARLSMKIIVVGAALLIWPLFVVAVVVTELGNDR